VSVGGSRMRATSPRALNRPVRPMYFSSSRVRSRSDSIALKSLESRPSCVSNSWHTPLYFGHSKRKCVTVSAGPSCSSVLQLSQPFDGVAPILFK
jgi:hypothetical protein